jgi:hypothetical protein
MFGVVNMNKQRDRVRQRIEENRQFPPNKLNLLAKQAQQELVYSDYISVRCHKSGLVYPQTWQERDDVLRKLVNSDRNTLIAVDFKIPARPAKPWESISAIGTTSGSSNTEFDSA